MSGEHAPNDILVDLDAEGSSDLLGDAHAAKVRIAALQRDDGGEAKPRRMRSAEVR